MRDGARTNSDIGRSCNLVVYAYGVTIYSRATTLSIMIMSLCRPCREADHSCRSRPLLPATHLTRPAAPLSPRTPDYSPKSCCA
jgi:hypothetical protein